MASMRRNENFAQTVTDVLYVNSKRTRVIQGSGATIHPVSTSRYNVPFEGSKVIQISNVRFKVVTLTKIIIAIRSDVYPIKKSGYPTVSSRE